MSRSRCASVLAAVLILASSVPATRGQGNPPGAGNDGTSTPPAEGKKPASPSDEELRQVLGKALEVLNALDEEGPKDRLPSFSEYANRLEPADKARALCAIATARARVGDRAGARETSQDALQAAYGIESNADKVDLLRGVAAALTAAGDRDGALAALRQAQAAAGRIKGDPMMPAPLRMEMEGDEGAKRVEALGKVAAAQATAGDPAAARKTFQQANQAADAIARGPGQVSALADLAQTEAAAGAQDAARATFEQATQLALALKDETQRSRSLGAVLRARVKAGDPAAALATVRDRLQGDPRAFCLWAVTDALIDADRTLTRDLAGQLVALARDTDYENIYKKAKVLTRVAEAQAQVGESDASLQTVASLGEGGVQPLPLAVQQAMVTVLIANARAQAKAKDRKAAQETLQKALDLAKLNQPEGASFASLIDDLIAAQAEAEDFDGALQTAEVIYNGANKATALAGIATTLAETKDLASARAVFQQALRAADRIPNDELWFQKHESGPLKNASYKAHALTIIATAQAKAGDLPGALQTVATITSENPMQLSFELFQAYQAIAPIQAQKGDFAGALKTLAAVGGDDPFLESQKADILARVATIQAEAGDAPGVLAWVRPLKAPKAKGLAIKGLAEGIAPSKAPKSRP